MGGGREGRAGVHLTFFSLLVSHALLKGTPLRPLLTASEVDGGISYNFLAAATAGVTVGFFCHLGTRSTYPLGINGTRQK